MKHSIITLVSTLFVLTSCGQDSGNKAQQVIWNHLIETNTIKENPNSKILDIKLLKTVTAKDSANYLLSSNFRKMREEYDSRLKNMRASLILIAQNQDKLDKEQESMQESRKQYLQDEIKRWQESVDESKVWIDNLYSAINGDYQGSDYDDLFKRIENYQTRGNEELGRIYETHYQALEKSGGSRSIQEYTSHYLLNTEEQEVIGFCYESELHFFDDQVNLDLIRAVEN